MISNGTQSKGKRILKRLGITAVVLLGLLGVGFIEAIFTGSNFDDHPADGLIWLSMVAVDITATVVLIKLIARA